MDVKREFDRDDESDGKLGLSENLVGSFEREYDIGNTSEGDLDGSGDSGGSLHLKFSSDKSALESSEENRSPFASQLCTHHREDWRARLEKNAKMGITEVPVL